MFEGGEVGGRVIGSDAAFVVAEDHVHHPVQAVLDRPVTADDRPDLAGKPGKRGAQTTALKRRSKEKSGTGSAALRSRRREKSP